MSFKPLHNLDDGLVTRNSFVPISDGTDVQKCTTQQLISTALGAGSDLEFNASNFLSIKGGSIDSSKIAAGAVTADKIEDGGIDLTKIKTEGESSFPISTLRRKTICLHIGNYYRGGTKYTADDSLNFNSGINRYEARSEIVVNSINDESMNYVWGDLHTDATEVHIIEPFATLSAAARFVQYNYGPNLSVVFLVHGHVAATGSYDLDVNKRISQVVRWTAFDNIAIVAGASPYHNDSDSHYANYFTPTSPGTIAARIDWDQDTKDNATGRERSIGFDFSGVNIAIGGINFVFNSTQNFSSVQNRFSAGEFHISGVRMSTIGDIDNFIPYFIDSNGKMFFGNPDIPSRANEFSFKENGTLFLAQGSSTVRYAKNSDDIDILIRTYKTGTLLRFCHLIEGSTFDLGDKDTEVYFENSSNINTNIAPIIFENGQNRFMSNMQSVYYLGGGNAGGDYTWEKDSRDDLFIQKDEDITDSSNRKNYTDIKTHSTSIYKKATSITDTIFRERVTSDSDFMSAPSARSSNPYTDQ